MLPRKYRPLAPDHPSIGDPCAVCKRVFQAGDETTLLTGPPASNEDWAKKMTGQSYVAMAGLVHWRCHPEVDWK